MKKENSRTIEFTANVLYVFSLSYMRMLIALIVAYTTFQIVEPNKAFEIFYMVISGVYILQPSIKFLWEKFS